MIAVGIDPGSEGAIVVIERRPGLPWSVLRIEEWRRWHEAPEEIGATAAGLPAGIGQGVVAAVEGIEVTRRDRGLAGALTLAQRAGECIGALRAALPEATIYQAPARDWRHHLLGVSMGASGDGSLAMLRRALDGQPSAIEADRPELAVLPATHGPEWVDQSEHVVEAAGLAMFAAMGLGTWRWDRAGSWAARRSRAG